MTAEQKKQVESVLDDVYAATEAIRRWANRRTRLPHEDLKQEIALHLCRKIGKHNPAKGSFKDWAIEVGFKRVKGLVRYYLAEKRDANRSVSLDDGYLRKSNREDDPRTPSSRIADYRRDRIKDMDDRDEVFTLLDKIASAPTSLIALVRHYLQGKPQSQIAKEQGCSQQKVSYHLQAGLGACRSIAAMMAGRCG